MYSNIHTSLIYSAILNVFQFDILKPIYVDQTYHIELQINDTTDMFYTVDIDSWGQLRYQLYNKRDGFSFQ